MLRTNANQPAPASLPCCQATLLEDAWEVAVPLGPWHYVCAKCAAALKAREVNADVHPVRK